MADVAGWVTWQADLDRLSLSTNPFLERNLEYLSECMDDLGLEQQKVRTQNASPEKYKESRTKVGRKVRWKVRVGVRV